MQQLRILGCYAQTELGHGSNVAVRTLPISIYFRVWRLPPHLTKKQTNL
jgi:hypothetical protein